MESFNRGQVVAVFLHVEKAFDNVRHNGLRYKIFQLDLPTKITRWLSDFYHCNTSWQCNTSQCKWFLVQPDKSRVLSWVHYFFWFTSMIYQHSTANKILSQFADDTAQWAFSLKVRFATKFLQQDLLNLAMWCAKWRIKLNPEKTKVIIFSREADVTATLDYISKDQRLQNKFIRLALRLPKYICPKLPHDSSALPYLKDRLLSCVSKSLDRIAQNLPIEEAISSNYRLNPAWDRFPTPLSVVRPASL